MNFSPEGRVTGGARSGAPQLDAGSLLPYFVYRDRRLSPDRLLVDVTADGRNGLASVRIHGPWEGPREAARAPGWVDYRVRLMEGVPYLFIKGEVQYLATYRRQVIHEKKPMLARKIGDGWEAVGGPDTEYRIQYDAPDESEKKTVTVVGRTAFVDASQFTEFDRDYIATVEALHPDVSPATPPSGIRFRSAAQAEDAVEIPKDFAPKLLWADLSAWLRRNLL